MTSWRIAATIATFGLLGWMLAFSPITAKAAGQTAVGVIQYNVKGGQGGWTKKGGAQGNEDIRAKQVALIVKEISARKAAGDPVDFITLEQADMPLLQDDLQNAGLLNWNTLISVCKYDQIQLSYSPDWQLAAGTTPASGCWQQGRPYNIASFSNARTGATVLYVIVHMPHIQHLNQCTVPITPSDFGAWHLSSFTGDVAKVAGSGDLAKLNLIISGDMNELGACGTPGDFANIFSAFGAVTKSPNRNSCCDDNGFTAAFDHIVTNTGTISKTAIIDDGVYPLDPGFNERVCTGSYCPRNEEHKAIYGVVTLPTP